MVRHAHHERLEFPLVLSSSKDALRSKRWGYRRSSSTAVTDWNVFTGGRVARLVDVNKSGPT